MESCFSFYLISTGAEHPCTSTHFGLTSKAIQPTGDMTTVHLSNNCVILVVCNIFAHELDSFGMLVVQLHGPSESKLCTS